MSRRLIVIVAALGLAVGCGRDNAASSPNPASPVVAKATKVLKPVTVEAEPKPPAETPPPEAALAIPPSPTSAPAPADAPAEEPPPVEAETSTPGARERIVLLTPGGPLVMDVWLTIDGRPHTEGFEKLLKQILAAGDTDKDGKPTWTELVENEKFLASKLAGAGQMNNYQARQWIELFDVNRDNRIQPSEAKSWLGRDAAAGADAFAVRSEKSFAPQPSATSSVWKFLDADHDGRLSAAETRQAPASLLSVDADDDRVITPRELASLRDQLVAADPQAANRLRGAGRYAAIHLNDEDADRIQYLLQDAYAPRQDLGPQSFPAFPKLFDELDADDDGMLVQDELARLADVKAHLELAVAFENGSPKSPATVRVMHTAPEITATAEAEPDRVVLIGGGARLIVSANDLSAAAGAYQPMAGSQVAGRRQIRLMVHDQNDALFAALDEDRDGRLGEREIAFSSDKMQRRDENRDGQVSEDELPYAMVVAFLRGEAAAEQSFYAPPAARRELGDAKRPMWFVRSDLNGDGDVSRREFLGGADQFSRLDGNGDGYVDASEISMFQSEADGNSG